MKTMRKRNTNAAQRILIAILLIATLLSLASCDSKVSTATSVLVDQFEDVWILGAKEFTDIELFHSGDTPCYYIGYDTVNEGENIHVNAIIVTDTLTETSLHYIHSVDFERTERNKKYHQAYLDAQENGTVYVFSAEEIEEIQQNLYDKLGTDFIE